MIRYALQRLLTAIPTMLLLITMAFFMIRLAPGGPFDSERDLPPEIENNLNTLYHLDEPLPVQYVRYLTQIAMLDFGPSFQYRDWSVNRLIADGFPVSFVLGILALTLAIIGGTTLGVIAALRHNSSIDFAAMTIAMSGISMPAFVLAPLFILVFSIQLGWLPAGGWQWQPKQMILPAMTLALPMVAYIARLARASLLEVLHTPYIRAAYAKGIPRHTVLLRHALRPTLLPVISYLGPAAASIIVSSVVIERIFSIPGLGTHLIQGTLNRDYTLVLGIVIVYGLLIIVFNFLVDLLYAVLDPRIRDTHGQQHG